MLGVSLFLPICGPAGSRHCFHRLTFRDGRGHRSQLVLCNPALAIVAAKRDEIKLTRRSVLMMFSEKQVAGLVKGVAAAGGAVTLIWYGRKQVGRKSGLRMDKEGKGENGAAAEPRDEDAKKGIENAKLKTIHFIRHGEGFHNIGFEATEDAHLTVKGWTDAKGLKKHIESLKDPLKVQVVFASPLTRALETACGVFGTSEEVGEGMKLLMEGHEEVLNVCAQHGPIAGRSDLPFIADERARERMSLNRCDRHRPMSETKKNFPGVDFSRVEEEMDTLWDAKHEEAVNANMWGSRFFLGEKGPAVAERGQQLIRNLLERPEEELALVAHNEFLFHTLTAAAEGCAPDLKQKLARRFFNCEMRSVKFDESTGKPVEVVASTSYPGALARYWLFPVNWAMHHGGTLVEDLSKRYWG